MKFQRILSRSCQSTPSPVRSPNVTVHPPRVCSFVLCVFLMETVAGHPQALLLLGLALRVEGHPRRIAALFKRLIQSMERLSLTLLAMCQQAPVRSLRATIAASEQTLSDEARALWRQLARWQPARQIFSEEELVAENVDLTALDTFFSRHMVG